MSFLQPWMLFALPLAALPVIIHLINQRRFRTIRWGAMMFLLAADKMSRGYARIRQWLILAARTLAIAGLLFAVSRPLASGWLGLTAGGAVDTTIVLLDRSPSMLERGPDGGKSKLETGRDQLVRSLGLLGSKRWLLIDGSGDRPVEAESVETLANLMGSGGVAASADLPAMLRSAYDYVRENRPSRTEVWICSDVRQHDWSPESGRWREIRDLFQELPQPVRFHLLAYPDAAPENRAIRMTAVRRAETSDGAELLLSFRVDQAKAADDKATVPVQVEVDGARSEVTVELSGTTAEIEDHSVSLEPGRTQGWGRVSIPADSNGADNAFYFVYQKPTARKAVIVADDPEAVRPLQLAAAVAPDPSLPTAVETVEPGKVVGSVWDDVSLVLWQAELPQGEAAERMRSFLARGGQAIFFPPESPGVAEFSGVHWEDWQEPPEPTPIAGWTGDQDLLAKTRSGTALPVGALEVHRYCTLAGDQTTLATLSGGAPLLGRAVSAAGPESSADAATAPRAYFCATTAAEGDSSLARDGVVLYVIVQRALAAGAASLETARQVEAGTIPAQSTLEWRPVSDVGDALPATFGSVAGVYQKENLLFAVNRGEAEDRAAVVPEARVAELFRPLDFDRVDDRAGGGTTLVAEIWRLFLALMMAALLVEAALCLPKIAARRPSPASFFPTPSPQGAVA